MVYLTSFLRHPLHLTLVRRLSTRTTMSPDLIHPELDSEQGAARAVGAAATLAGLEFDESEIALMLSDMRLQSQYFNQLRSVSLANSVAPALHFSAEQGADGRDQPADNDWQVPGDQARPEDLEVAAFWSLAKLAGLIRSRQVSSVELTEMYLTRLRRHDPALHCVVTLTEELALAQARRADAEIAAGRWRGPLHGIPWGAKDLLAVHGYPTTWGAEPYRDQILDQDATVVKRLEAAGAVLVAKLSLGELAWGDVWFGGMTRSPWNPELGSSGSSAGSAAATAAGLVGFSIGSETWGSIVSPATQCGVTGLRPTFGRVSRHGAMALSWSMDKLGPLCRTVEDCALVFTAIHGADGLDPTAVTRPFSWPSPARLADLRIGYLAGDFDQNYPGDGAPGKENDQQSLAVLADLGANLIPIALPDYPIQPLQIILSAEAAAAFDDLTRSNQDDLLARQVQDAWPNVLRAARLIPAVEYIQANRVRTLLIQAMDALMADIDVYVSPSLVGDNLLLTNLTGHPAVVVPNGFTANGMPSTITFTGRPFAEATALAVAKAYQEATDFHLQRPPAFVD